MAKKESINVKMIKIFFRSIKLYFMNLTKFCGYMAFPVLGALIGLIYVFAATYLFSVHELENGVNNLFLTLLFFIFILIPGFLTFFKAFFDYLVALVALNSAALDLVATDTLVNEVQSYNSIVMYREKQFLLLLIMLSVVYSILSFPFLLVFLVIFAIYACLSFQAFAADDRFTALEAIQRSFRLVPGNVVRTIVLLALIGIFTYIFLPEVLFWITDVAGGAAYLAMPVDFLLKNTTLSEIFILPMNNALAAMNIDFEVTTNILAMNITKMIFASVIIGFTLPLRAIACTLWYKELDERNSAGTSTAKKMAKIAQEKE